jgi:hypothetical protein
VYRPGDVTSLKQLREMRRIVEVREMYARRRLIDIAATLLSPRGLVSLLVPEGSWLDRLVELYQKGRDMIRGFF